MGLVEIDTSNEDLFKPYEFKVLPKGKHRFEVANDLVVEPAKSSDNNVIKVELRCQDEDENKGSVVFDTFVLIENPQTEKHRKSRQINQGRLAQFAVACGVRTKEEIESGKGIPLDEFKGKICDAITRIVPYKDPNTGEAKQSAKIARYLFEPEGN